MGCDIYAMIEAKRRYSHSDMWSWHGCGRLYLSRDYFAKLAGVRNYDNIPADREASSRRCRLRG